MPIDFDAIRRRRVELNRLIRRECLVRNAVPTLSSKPWAKRWRAFHQNPCNNAIRRYRRELATIAKLIGPAPVLWKPRTAKGCGRIASLYPTRYTPQFRRVA